MLFFSLRLPKKVKAAVSKQIVFVIQWIVRQSTLFDQYLLIQLLTHVHALGNLFSIVIIVSKSHLRFFFVESFRLLGKSHSALKLVVIYTTTFADSVPTTCSTGPLTCSMLSDLHSPLFPLFSFSTLKYFPIHRRPILHRWHPLPPDAIVCRTQFPVMERSNPSRYYCTEPLHLSTILWYYRAVCTPYAAIRGYYKQRRSITSYHAPTRLPVHKGPCSPVHRAPSTTCRTAPSGRHWLKPDPTHFEQLPTRGQLST